MRNREHEMAFRSYAIDVIKILNTSHERGLSVADEMELLSELLHTRAAGLPRDFLCKNASLDVD